MTHTCDVMMAYSLLTEAKSAFRVVGLPRTTQGLCMSCHTQVITYQLQQEVAVIRIHLFTRLYTNKFEKH